MIDLHSHILPGIDDGPADLAGSIAMARVYVERGSTTVVATPHVSWGYLNSAEEIASRVIDLRTALATEGVQLRVLPGAEVALTRAIEMDRDELRGLCLGDGPWLLLEPPISVDSPRLEGMIGTIQSRGLRVLLAHPERCVGFHGDQDLLERLVRSGCLAQLTASSLVGAFGRTAQAAARRYANDGLAHAFSADAHDAILRPPGLCEPLAEAGYEPLAAWFTRDVPQALLNGSPLPQRPPFEPSRTGWRWWR